MVRNGHDTANYYDDYNSYSYHSIIMVIYILYCVYINYSPGICVSWSLFHQS